MSVSAKRSANRSARFNLTEMVKRSDVLLQVWPVYSVRNKERVQVGFELELLGSHSLDPSHLDPSCPECSELRATLYGVAGHFAREAKLNGQGPLLCTVTRPSSIVCLQRYNNRAFVRISIEINARSDMSLGPSDIAVINDLRSRMRDHGIHEP